MNAARVLLVLVLAAAACSRPDAAPDVPPAAPDGAIEDDAVRRLVERALDAVRAAPGDAAAWLCLARAYDANGLDVLAVPCYRRAVDVEPGDAHAWYDLANVLETTGRHDEAIATAGRAAALAPDYPPIDRSVALWSLEHGDLDAAESAARRAVLASQRAPGALVVLARILLDRGRDAEAAAAGDRGVLAYARFLRGTALARIGRIDEAAAELAGALEPPQLPDPWRAELARWRVGFGARLAAAHRLIRADRPEEAIELLAALDRERAGHLQVLTDLGTAELLAGRPAKAVDALSRAVLAHPGALPPRLQLVRALWAAGRADEAARAADAAVAAHGDDASAFEARGLLSLRRGRAAAALPDFEEATRLAPANASAAALAGAAALALDRLDEASRRFEVAAALDPSQPTAIAGLALVALRRGDAAAAQRQLARIGELPDDGVPLVAQARAELARKGR